MGLELSLFPQLLWLQSLPPLQPWLLSYRGGLHKLDGDAEMNLSPQKSWLVGNCSTSRGFRQLPAGESASFRSTCSKPGQALWVVAPGKSFPRILQDVGWGGRSPQGSNASSGWQGKQCRCGRKQQDSSWGKSVRSLFPPTPLPLESIQKSWHLHSLRRQ